jgi:hypothetical protein
MTGMTSCSADLLALDVEIVTSSEPSKSSLPEGDAGGRLEGVDGGPLG